MTPVDPPHAGSSIELIRLGEREPFAEVEVVEAHGGDLALPACPALVDETVVLRYWDADDAVWESTAAVNRSTGSPEAPLVVRPLEGWKPAVLRRAARAAIARQPVELLTIGGDGAVVRRVRGSCLDLSSGGCRVAGTGSRPLAGDLIQVESGYLPAPIDARIVRTAQTTYGAWEAGIEFLPHDAGERSALIGWRDASR